MAAAGVAVEGVAAAGAVAVGTVVEVGAGLAGLAGPRIRCPAVSARGFEALASVHAVACSAVGFHRGRHEQEGYGKVRSGNLVEAGRVADLGRVVGPAENAAVEGLPGEGKAALVVVVVARLGGGSPDHVAVAAH